MCKTIILMCALMLSLSWTQVTVKKVLETSDVMEYNSWVLMNKQDHPALKPVLVRSLHEQEELGVIKYTIEYYGKTGDQLTRAITEDSLYTAIVPITNDRVILLKWKPDTKDKMLDEVTVRNPCNEVLFTMSSFSKSISSVAYIGSGLYVEQLSPFGGRFSSQVELRIFNDGGNQIGKLRGVGFIDYVREIVAPGDERYVAFIGFTGRGNTPLIVLNKKGNEVWRQDFTGRYLPHLYCSRAGEAICVNHEKHVYVYAENGILKRKYNPFDNDDKVVLGGISDDGRWLAVALNSSLKIYDNETGSIVWLDTTTLAATSDTVRFLSVIANGKFVAVLCKSHNMYVFGKDGEQEALINLNIGEYMSKRRVRIDNEIKMIEHKALRQDWYCENIDNYLVINRNIPDNVKSHGLEYTVYVIE